MHTDILEDMINLLICFNELFCDNRPKAFFMQMLVNQVEFVIGIDTKIEVIVASPTTWEAHHSPRAKPEGCGELPRSLVTQQ